MTNETNGISLRRLKTFLTNLKNIFAEKNHSHATSDITGLDTALSSKATSAQGSKADTAVQSVKIGTTEYKSGTTVTLPSYPTSLPASDVPSWAKQKTKPTYTASEVGLGNVGNFKAVSTVESQGLTDTEKSNARANIGAQVAGSYASSTHNHDDKYQAKGSYAASNHTHTTVNGHTVNSDVPSGAKFTDTNTWRPQPDWNATSGDAVIKNKPTIPSVGNGTVTITQNGTSKGTFTMNQSGNTTIALTDTNTDTNTVTNIGTTSSNYSNGNILIQGSGATTVSKSGNTVTISSTNTDTNTWRPLGTTADTACAGNDSRLSNARPANGGTSTYANYVYATSHQGSWYQNSQWDGTYFQTNYKNGDNVLPMKVNNAGYADSAGSVAWSNVSGRPSSMPASDVYSWAKASTKPGYSWSEIGSKPSTFTPSSHTHNYAGSSSAGGSANSLYYFQNTSSTNVGQAEGGSNAIAYISDYSGTALTSGVKDGALYRQAYSTSWVHQIYGDYRTGQIAVRGKNNGTWQNWRRVLDESNYKTFCTPANIGAAASNHSHSNYLTGINKSMVVNALGYTPPTSDTNTWRGVQNNLTSTATDQSLSAYQGKVLKDLVNTKTTFTYSSTQPTSPASNAVWVG